MGPNNYNMQGQTYPSAYYNNPQQQLSQQATQLPQTRIIEVAGRSGAESEPLGPNSTAWWLDKNGTMAWFVATDIAGNKITIAPYDISPHEEPPEPDLTSLVQRLQRLEEVVNGFITASAADAGSSSIPDQSDRSF